MGGDPVLSPRRVAIHQPNFLPWLGFAAKAAQADVLVLLDDVPFSRGSVTNRVRITEDDWLTIPVKKRMGQPIREVEIDSWDWESRAYDKLHRAFRGAPYWRRMATLWPEILLLGDETSLSEINTRTILWTLRTLRVECRIVRASDLRPEPTPGVPGLIELVRLAEGSCYVAGKGAAAYDEPAAWAAAGIGYSVAKFTPRDDRGLSAIDVILREGAPGDVLRGCIR